MHYAITPRPAVTNQVVSTNEGNDSTTEDAKTEGSTQRQSTFEDRSYTDTTGIYI